MARLGRWCFEHRKKVLAAWLLAVAVIVGVSVAAGSSFNSNNSLPGTDSQAAATLLTQNFPAASGEGDQVGNRCRRRCDRGSIRVRDDLVGKRSLPLAPQCDRHQAVPLPQGGGDASETWRRPALVGPLRGRIQQRVTAAGLLAHRRRDGGFAALDRKFRRAGSHAQQLQ